MPIPYGMNNRKRQKKKNRRDILFEHVREEYGLFIFGFCRSFFPFDRTMQDTLYNEILYRIWLKLDHYAEGTDLGAWVYRVSRHVAVNMLKHERRRRFFLPLTRELEQTIAAADDDTSQIDTLYRLVDRLSIRERELVFLYLEQVPQADIARLTGMSETSVSTKIYRIKKKLKTMYENEREAE